MKRTEIITVQWKTVPYIYNTTCKENTTCITVSDTLAQSYVHKTSRHQARQQRRQPKGKQTRMPH